MVGIEIAVEVKNGKRAEFLQAADSLQITLGGPGASGASHLYEERGHPNSFLWVERLKDIDEVKARLDSARFRTLVGAIRVLAVVNDLRLVEFRNGVDLLEHGDLLTENQ